MKLSKKIIEIDRLVSQLSRQRTKLDTSDEMMLETIQDTITGILYTIHLNKVEKDRELSRLK